MWSVSVLNKEAHLLQKLGLIKPLREMPKSLLDPKSNSRISLVFKTEFRNLSGVPNGIPKSLWGLKGNSTIFSKGNVELLSGILNRTLKYLPSSWITRKSAGDAEQNHQNLSGILNEMPKSLMDPK